MKLQTHRRLLAVAVLIYISLCYGDKTKDMSLYTFHRNKVLCDKELPDHDKQLFFHENDFGQVYNFYWSRLLEHCIYNISSKEPTKKKSSLRCTPGLTFCHAKHWAITFDNITDQNELAVLQPLRYCSGKITPTQSIRGGRLFNWKKEYDNVLPGAFVNASSCTVMINKPTLIIQPDSHANYGHAMCDFTNLYLSLHIANLTRKKEGLRVIVLANNLGYSRFSPLYNVITSYENIQFMNSLGGQTFCFKNMYLAVNPRTFHTFFYNMPIRNTFYTHGCRSNGGFIHTFSEEIKKKICPEFVETLIYSQKKKDRVIRIGLLSRSSGTGYTSGSRHLLNERKLITTVREKNWDYPVKIEYLKFDWNDHVRYEDQVRLVSQLDILVGLHGSGMTHMLFIPRWGAVVELYNMGDKWLQTTAALKGIKWIHGDINQMEKVTVTSNEPMSQEIKSNPKFWNYRISESHFINLIEQAIHHVRDGYQLSPHSTRKDEL